MLIAIVNTINTCLKYQYEIGVVSNECLKGVMVDCNSGVVTSNQYDSDDCAGNPTVRLYLI